MKRKFKTRLIGCIMVGVMMSLNFATVKADTNQFSDVTSYYPYNSWAVETGKKHSLIFLENNTREAKRWEIASILYNIADIDRQIKQANFNDLFNVSDYIAERINVIANNKIVQGYNDGTFKPYNNVTRAEFVVMLDRANLINNFNSEKQSYSFIDITNHWASNSIIKVVNSEIMSGKGDNKFCPEDNITPQEILIILDRLVTQGTITSEKLVNTMVDTFKCKQYGKEEQYIVEIMYNEFDYVQQFMKINFPFKEYYDYNDWYKLATFEDIQYIAYFLMSYNSQILDDDGSKELFNQMGTTIIENKLSNYEYYTVRDFLHAIADIEYYNCVQSKAMGANGFSPKPQLQYINKEEFTLEDQEVFRRILGGNESKLATNNGMYFPFEAPLTKYMLNYFAVLMINRYFSYYNSISSAFVFSFDKPLEYETDITKLPYNYKEYPYIIKDVPKEVYEKEYMYNDTFKITTPVECYKKYSLYMRQMGEYANNYYNTILNVDYRTIDEKSFGDIVSKYLYYVSNEEIKRYVDYVKENEIIIQGSGVAVPGTLYFVDIAPRMRTILNIKIISAKNKKNLLFGDFSSIYNKDIEYISDEFSLINDITLYRVPITYPQRVLYEIDFDPILEGVKWKKDSFILP